MTDNIDLFEAVIDFPDRAARARYEALVGIDDVKEQLQKEGQMVLVPDALAKWSEEHHGQVIAACNSFNARPPMFLFAGDVGTGKTALAETFGDQIARDTGRPVLLYRLSLSSRGSGAVGEMTKLITAAFSEVRDVVTAGAQPPSVVLLIDEADALAQSREAAQMHHEDRAGVNALIRGLNSLTERALPVLVVLATNRLDAIDPAVRRRAAATFEFGRPDDDQRRVALQALTDGVDMKSGDLDRLVAATGPKSDVDFGCTYSDLYQRLIPAAVLAAFPDKPLTGSVIADVADTFVPTPPFTAS